MVDNTNSSRMEAPLCKEVRAERAMECPAEERFACKEVETLIRDVLEAHLRRVRYEQVRCSRLAQDLCAMIKEKAKELQLARYKLVAQVMIGQNTDHNVQISSRCLWNQNTDSFAAATYRNDTLYAVGMVFGMYLRHPDS